MRGRMAFTGDSSPNYLEQQLAASITATASAVVAAWDHAGRPMLRNSGVRPVEKVRRP